MDLGLVFGVSGLLVASVSLAYSHAQASSAKRQAEAEWRLARLELGNTFADRVRHARARIVGNAAFAAQYAEANPRLAEVAQRHGGLETVAVVRDFLDATQELFFLRRDGLISDHDWRGWMTSAMPIARTPAVREIFANAVERDALDPEFAPFFRPFTTGGVGDDPLGRVALRPPSAPMPTGASPPREPAAG